MMRIGSERWLTLIQDAAAQLGIAVGRPQAEQFSRHARCLMEWNRKINLTAITDPREVALKHYVDAIAPLPHIPAGGSLLDIGTGGGFPGIPLKIMHPGQPMTLIDSVRKKVNFVRHVIRQLPLEGIEALHTRAETLADAVLPEDRFDVIVCRALSDPRLALEWSQPLLAEGGRIVLYQGPNTGTDSDTDARRRLSVKGLIFRQTVITYPLPYTSHSRRVVVLERRS
jgi:16S rRNA (guanine527-N7)-methyltransferase